MNLSDYKDRHCGERVFLIGNGPSLSKTPLNKLQDEHTIAMNTIDLIYSDTQWRPTYYLNVIEPNDHLNRRAEIDKYVRHPMRTISLGTPSFMTANKKEFFPCKENIIYLTVAELGTNRFDILSHIQNNGVTGDFWSVNIEEKIYRKHTSMYTAAQLANYMGFDEFYFVGCDLYPIFKPFNHVIFKSGTDPLSYFQGTQDNRIIEFITRNGTPIRSTINGLCYYLLTNNSILKALYRLQRMFSKGESTHFHEDYPHGKGIFPFTKNDALVKVHEIIKIVGEFEGFQTYNATVGGQLEVHERVDIFQILN